MSTVDSIFYMVILFFMRINIIKLFRPKAMFYLSTLHQGRIGERMQLNKLKILLSLGFEPRPSAYRADALPTELRCHLAVPEY